MLGVQSFLRMNSALMRRLDEVSESSGKDYLYLVLFICLLAYAYLHKKKQITSILFWLCASYFILSYLLTVPFSISIDGLASLLVVIFWMFCYWFGRRLSVMNRELISNFTQDILLLVALPLSAYCIYIFFTTNLVLDQHASDAFFYIIAYFPFVLLMDKNKTLKIMMIGLFAFLVIISFKRSIIVGFFICLIVYFLNTDYKKLLTKWYMRLLLIATIVFGFYIFNYFSETLVGRFSDLESDQGSGRTIIYSNILSGFSSSDTFHMFFGHGFKSVRLITWTNELAHNDLLELLYDFGIIGFVIYLLYLITLLKNTLRHRKESLNKFLYSSCLSSLVLFFIISSLNCVIYSTMIITPFMLAFGIYTGLLSWDKQLK